MAECLCDRCVDGETPLRIAVDIEGELAMLSKAMRALDSARAIIEAAAKTRQWAEQAEQKCHDGWLSDSSRLRKLQRLAELLPYQADQLTQAMLASATIDDDIPF